MKFLFGPVNSRRLGLSLGIDLLPAKICNFNCIYCEAGPTTKLTAVRNEYTSTAEILAEFDQFLASNHNLSNIDVITITAAGEPTLHSGIGTIIQHIKRLTAKPIAVLTNGSLFHIQAVRGSLLTADIVIPSLDAARPESLRNVNRPIKNTDLNKIVAGLSQFRNEYAGKIWLEILLVKDINDRKEDILALNKAVMAIRPDRIQLNTVVRLPCESCAIPLSMEELTAIAGQFDSPVEIIADFKGRRETIPQHIEASEIINILRRRPGTVSDISEALSLDAGLAAELLKNMEQQQIITKKAHAGKDYYHTKNCQPC